MALGDNRGMKKMTNNWTLVVATAMITVLRDLNEIWGYSTFRLLLESKYVDRKYYFLSYTIGRSNEGSNRKTCTAILSGVIS